MVSKMGYLYLFDCLSGKALCRARITTDTVFVTCPQTSTGGILGVTARKGQLLQVSVNEQTLVPYVVSTLRESAPPPRRTAPVRARETPAERFFSPHSPAPWSPTPS